MSRKLGLTVALLILLLYANVVQGENSVGVKEGDWIEYNVTTTGTPPEEHNVTWSRMEILKVQGKEITVNVTTQSRNGTASSLVMDLNLEKGQIGAWWIIPANLSPGGTFYDAYLGQNITIEGEEQKVYAGSTRTVTNATVPNRLKVWDKSTGVFVVSSDNLPDYTIDVVAYRTNIWAEQVFGLDPATFYAIVFVAVVAIVAALILIVARRRKK